MRRACLTPVLVALLVGCSGAAEPQAPALTAQPETAASISPAPAPSPLGSLSTRAQPSPPSAPSGAAAPVSVEVVQDDTFFDTPSGNITCVLSVRGATCEIMDRTWQPPPAPADCELDWGMSIDLQPTRPALFLCAGDTLFGTATRTLDYDRALEAESFTCTSRDSGMTCRNDDDGHGFTLSRDRYTVS